MKFKHINTCWYFNKLDHRGQPYEWPCCGESNECDEDYVQGLVRENARMREALERIKFLKLYETIGPHDMICVIKELANDALEGKE